MVSVIPPRFSAFFRDNNLLKMSIDNFFSRFYNKRENTGSWVVPAETERIDAAKPLNLFG